MSMRIVEIVATLDAPVVATDEIHLDGVLAAAHPLHRQSPVGRATPASMLIDPPLPVMCLTVGGVSARLCTAAQYADDARSTTTRWVKRKDADDVDQLARPVNLALGPGKNRLGRLPIIASPTVTWHAVGDRRGVVRLLQRLTHLGSERASGYGFVRSIDVQYRETTTPEMVLVADGVAQRHLPAAWCDSSDGVITGALMTPYWHPARQCEQIVPAGARCVLRAAVVDAVRAAADMAATSAHRGRHRRRNAEAAARHAAQTGTPLSNRVRRELERARRERQR